MLAVEGELTAESPALRIRVQAAGSAVTARIDGTPDAMRLMRHIRSVVPLARAYVPWLVRAGLTLDLVVGGVRVARAGAGVESSALARLLGVSNLAIGR